MIAHTQAQQIIEIRATRLNEDTKELQIKRQKFLDWLSVNYFQDNLRVLEMYVVENEVKKTSYDKYNFFNPLHNTRTKINSETCLEIDKLPFEKSVLIIEETIASLKRNKIHFAVFYAKGQRSYHVRIYDFDELALLNPKQRIKAQILFWQKQVPFGCFNYVDTGIFVDEHELQLEFAPHWKYGTAFNLLLEYIPGGLN